MKQYKIILALCIGIAALLTGCSSPTSKQETEGVTEVVTEAITETETETEAKQYTPPSNKKTTVTHYCEDTGCGKEGIKTVTGLSGETEYYCLSHYNEMVEILADMISSSSSSNNSSSNSSSGYGYDPSDPYYSANDHDRDGRITDEEFQDAMNDAIIDLLLAGY